ncbi:MAG: hypothetical protein QM775_23415 [Pirellulales bacterium]
MPAMTLGHVLLGDDEATLDQWRTHELVHVRQFETWGPLMLPVMLFAGLYLSAHGRDPYYDNLFEREAYASAGSPYEVKWRPRRAARASQTPVILPQAVKA